MNILYFNDLDYSRVSKQFDKTVEFFKNDDFNSAEIKKLSYKDYYRAKLDNTNRLLFKFARYNGQTYILLMEVIYNHEYDKSRFLRGAKIDESKLNILKSKKAIPDKEFIDLNYVNHNTGKFHLLNKVLSFDDIQQKIFAVKPPVVIVGSAGSGKTVLTLEKIKLLKGNVLYVTLSPYLVDNSSRLYYSDNYVNEKQDVDFLSFKEYLETLKVIPWKELDFKSFNQWLHPRKQSFGIKESHKLFEEFRGVITGMDISKPFLSKKDYLDLGIKQSIFLKEERQKVYDAFIKYLEFLNTNNYHDLNICSFEWLKHSHKKYDFIVIDEAQDFTNIQLYIVLKSLKTAGNFILCGDSNQIVHPNFFSWSNVKTMFYKHDITAGDINVLKTNYRNSIDVTNIANKLLMIKNARFGSIDKESTFLVESLEENKGEVNFYSDTAATRKKLNDSTKRSTRYALLVMNQDEKAMARKIFKTPLLFSIHEAKGLEYENIILLNFISNYSREFNEIAQSITKEDMDNEELNFSRGKDKSDKSLDAYKFYINSLYVGITRAIKNLYILESSKKHYLMELLDLIETKEQINIEEEVSSMDDWKEEARKLEMQGKKEQADEIKKTILEIRKPGWEPLTKDNITKLKKEALDPVNYNKKAKDLIFMYALLYNDQEIISKLAELKYRKAEHPEYERNTINRKYYSDYNTDNVNGVKQKIRKYGVNFRDLFNLTPLLAAVENGSMKILDFLISENADTDVMDNNGRNPFRIAINKLYFSPQSISKLEDIFPRMLTDNIKVRVENRMIKIPNRKMEYFLLNIFMTLQDAIINDHRKLYEQNGVKAAEIENVIAQYPEVIMANYRKKRNYISSMLAKNEIDSNNSYNNELFLRTERGIYAINPELSVMVEDKWINVYELTGLKKIKILTKEEKQLQTIEVLISENEIIKQSNPEFAEQQKKFLLDWKQRVEGILKEKGKKDEIKNLDAEMREAKKKNKEKERMEKRRQKQEELERERLWRNKEKEKEKEERERLKAEKQKEDTEKQKKIDDMQYKLPL